MRKITFVTYLETYIMDISGKKSLNIHKLVRMLKTNYRLESPLILYCALTDKKHLLNKYTKNKYQQILKNLNQDTFLDNEYNDFSFKKIYEIYKNKSNVIDIDLKIKEKIRINTLQIMEEKKITNYRIYKDLSLNPGNINDYLRNGNCKKVSLKTASMICDFVMLK